MSLTQEELKRRFHYDPDTGVFTRTFLGRRGHSYSKKCGSRNSHGYITISINHKTYLAHRLAWIYVYGFFPKGHIDHINHNGMDNRIANLRDVSASINAHNSRNFRTKVYGSIGIQLTRNGTWQAKIGLDGYQVYLGTFTTKEEAQAAYLDVKLPLMPEGATV